jgi:hypothetical protein
LPGDEIAQRAALDAKIAELARYQQDVKAGTMTPDEAADELNVTRATVADGRLRFGDDMKDLIHSGAACRFIAIKPLVGQDHMKFEDFKDVNSFIRCASYNRLTPNAQKHWLQRFEVYLHAFNIICKSEAVFIHGLRTRSRPSSRYAGQCTSVDRSRAASGASGRL